MKLWLIALLLTTSVPAFAPSAEAACSYFTTDDAHTPFEWDFHFLRVQRFRCDGTVPQYSFTHRAEIFRFADGNPQGVHAVIAQAEFQSLLKRFPDGHEERSHFVALHDTQGLLGFTEAEYTDFTAANGSCAARANLYRGSPTSGVVTSTLPACVPTLGLLP